MNSFPFFGLFIMPELPARYMKWQSTEHYEKFLSLWKNIGQSVVEVEDAKKRLAELKRQVRVKLLRRTINLDFFK